MADRVQFIMDRMAVTFREMEELEVFTQEEVKSVVKKRTDYEYKLRRRQQTPADYYGYLQYELGLEELRVLRCRQLSKGQQGQNGDSDLSKELINKHRKLQSSFMRHISYVFERALRRFPDHMPLWDDYIRFLQDKHSNSTLNTVFGRALSLHPKKENLWLQAAIFEMNENSNAHAARVLLQRSLRINPNSEKLWQTYFELELWYVARGHERRRLLGLKAMADTPVGAPTAEDQQEQQLGVPWVVYRHATKNIPGLGFAMTLLKATGPGCAVKVSSSVGGSNRSVQLSSALQLEIQGDILSRFGGERAYWAAVVRLSAQEHVAALRQQQQLQKLATKKLQKKRSQQEAFSGEGIGNGTDESNTDSVLVVSRLRVVAGGVADSLALLEACRAATASAAAAQETSLSSFLAGCWCDVISTLSPALSVPVHEDVSLTALDLFRSQLREGEGVGPNVVEEVLNRLGDAAEFFQKEGHGSDSSAAVTQEDPIVLAAKLSIATLQTILSKQYPEVSRNHICIVAAKDSNVSLQSVVSGVQLWLKSNTTDVANIDVWTMLAEKAFRVYSISKLLNEADGGAGGADSARDRDILDLSAAVLSRGPQLLNSSPEEAADLSSYELKTSVFSQAIDSLLLRQTSAGDASGAVCAVQRALEEALLGRAPVTHKASSERIPATDHVYVSWLLRYTQLSLLLQGNVGWRDACEFVEKRCFSARPHCVATLALDRYYEQVVNQGMALLRATSSSSDSGTANSMEGFVHKLVQAAVSRCPSSPFFLEAAEELERLAGRHEEANHTRWKRGRAL